MIGGWVAGPEWIDACRRQGKLLQPVLFLARAMAPRELVVQESSGLKHWVPQTCRIASTFFWWHELDIFEIP